MKLRGFDLNKFSLGPSLSAATLQALETVANWRLQTAQEPYLVTFEPRLFQHWQSEAAELWVLSDSQTRATLKFHVSRREAGFLLRIEDLFVDSTLRGSLLIVEFLEHFISEMVNRWPGLTLVGIGDRHLEILPILLERRRRRPQSPTSRLPRFQVHQAWSRLYVIQSKESQWLRGLRPSSNWRPSDQLAESFSTASASDEVSATSLPPHALSLAGLREWRWPEVWRTKLAKLSMPLSASGPPFPIVALEFKNRQLTALELEKAIDQLDPQISPRTQARAVIWIRDPHIPDSEVQRLDLVLESRELNLQLNERRVLVMTASAQVSAEEIYHRLNLQASEI